MSIDTEGPDVQPRPAALTESPRMNKKARMRRKETSLDHPTPSALPGTLITATQPRPSDPPATHPTPGNPFALQRRAPETDLPAELEILRTQVRAAKSETKTYADANADLTRRALTAEREAQVSVRARAQADHDTGIWKQRAEAAQQDAERQEQRATDAERRRWAEAFRGQAERNLALAEEGRKKAEAAVGEAERRAQDEKSHKRKAEKMVEAYRLVLKDVGILEEGLRRDRIAGRCVELVDGTERRENKDGGIQEQTAFLIS